MSIRGGSLKQVKVIFDRVSGVEEKFPLEKDYEERATQLRHR